MIAIVVYDLLTSTPARLQVTVCQVLAAPIGALATSMAGPPLDDSTLNLMIAPARLARTRAAITWRSAANGIAATPK